MSPSWRRALTILLLTLTLVVAALMITAWAMLPLDRTAITIDGERFSLADLTGTHAAVAFVIAVAAVVFSLVVAIMAAVFGLGLGAVGLAFGGLVAAGSLALVVAPFALVLWLMWRLVRSRPPTVLPARP